MVWAWRTGRRFQIKGFIEIVSFTVSWLDRSILPHICCTFITSDFKLFNSLKIFSLSVLWPCLCPLWLNRYKMQFSFFSSLSLFWPCLSREIWINFDRLQKIITFTLLLVRVKSRKQTGYKINFLMLSGYKIHSLLFSTLGPTFACSAAVSASSTWSWFFYDSSFSIYLYVSIYM